ncbi:ABC transporter ATP-binding protein [Derxia gummosa]|uniref:ABC transporter ATP-binding protein n=1 Tax=Derxia gummosa DSM 723 TaxID=1121388 RepID=A0A8B6XA04_9BURK|nr:ABC transporter ATP-binding protein [Derxia gummosa]
MIEVEDLHKEYALGDLTVSALRGVNLGIADGECVFIGGKSGSGKSTLLHLVGGLDLPSRGSVRIDGFDTASVPDPQLADFRARHIGFVFQNFNLMPVLTVAENVEYPLLLLRERDRAARVKRVLEEVGLAEHARKYPNQLSGGQRQRVAIARGLVHEPRLLIADEPTANLDSDTGTQVMALMHRLASERGSTLVICSHDPELLAGAPRVVTMRDGRVEHDRRSATAPAQADDRAIALA